MLWDMDIQRQKRVRALAGRLSALGGSNVTVGDTSRNWYADKGISTLSIPKSWQIIELHMDGASASARGGHVIIKSGYKPDAYDAALAHFIGGFTPGRANTIVGRSNLANVNRAAVRGYSYRLLECGFITNQTDLNKFNNNLDTLARGILGAFGIGTTAQAGWVADKMDGGIAMQTEVIRKIAGSRLAATGIGLITAAMLFTIPGKSSMGTGIISSQIAVW